MNRSVTFAISMLTVLGLSGCSDSKPQPVSASDHPPAVAVVKVERHDLARDTEIAAEFRPFQEVEVHAKVAGFLKSIRVDVGDRVRKGELIGTLEIPEYHEELAHAEATEKRTELDVTRAQSEVHRAQSAYQIRQISYNRLLSVAKAKPNLIAQQEIDTAAAQFRESEAQLATAKATLEAVRQQVRVASATKSRVETMMNYLRITAPFSGIVTKRYADTGAMIQAGTASQTQAMPVVRISDVDRLRLVLPVPESVTPRVKIGSPVEVRVDSLNRVFQGRVARFNGRLDTGTRTMEAEVDVQNPGGAIKPGMYGYASLRLERRDNVLAVPVQAANVKSGAATVLVVAPGGTLEERVIRTGLETPELIEVIAGVAEGDLLVLGTKNRLRPGMRVEAKLLGRLGSTGGH
jgi:RND family efflux transporter MFP subunit